MAPNAINKSKMGVKKKTKKILRMRRANRRKQLGLNDDKRDRTQYTPAVLKKIRTNPRANIKLSVKKQRLLATQLKHQHANRNEMEATNSAESSTGVVSQGRQADGMDVE